MADVQIDQDAANIPAVNLINGSTDPAAPGSGHAKLYLKDGVAYVRLDTGDPAALGGTVALAEGQLAVGDGSGLLSALGLGTEGQVVTADANGMAAWATPEAPEGGGDLVKIATVTVTGSPAASIDFSNIPGTYAALKLVGTGRVTATVLYWDFLKLNLNGDTGNNYSIAFFDGYAANNAIQASSNQAYAKGPQVASASGGAPYAGHFEITIPHYADTTFDKGGFWQGSCHYGGAEAQYVFAHGAFVWASASAITSIAIGCVAGTSWVVGSTVTLYGLK